MSVELRNHVAVIVVANYDDTKVWPKLNSLASAEPLLGELYLPFEPAMKLDPNSDDAWHAIKSTLARAKPGSAVVIHWIGHGDFDGCDFFLICKESPQTSRLNSRCSISAAELGREVARCQARCVTLIVDTCYSGAAVADLAADLLRRMEISAPVQGDSTTVRIVGASHPLSQAVAGEMSRAIILACDHLDSGDSYVDISEIKNIAANTLGFDTSQWRAADLGWERRTFPNPYFRRREGIVDIETQRRLETVQQDQHFNLAARGVEVGGSGYFFSGRHETLSRLAHWLNQPENGTLIVTGSPGSGKSALIGKTILSSIPEKRLAKPLVDALWPDAPAIPQAAIRCAIHAKGKSVFDVATVIGEAAGVYKPVRDSEGIVSAVAAYAKLGGGALVIDALDEAAEGQTLRITNEIIRPLQRNRATKILLGTRRSLDGRPIPDGEARYIQLRAEFPDALIIDMDDESETESDIAAFARVRLKENAYGAQDIWISRTAEAVAKAVGKDFLAARLLVRSLEDRPNCGLDDLPGAARAAFLWDIRQRFPADFHCIIDMMRALAFACGRGVSRQVWPLIANALSREERKDADVDFMLRRLGSYIIETSVNTRGIFQSTYRLIHQSLADFFLEQVGNGHRQIATALMAGLEGHAWFKVDAYFRRHLAEHARLGGVIDQLLVQPGYLAVAEAEDVLLALPSASEATAVVAGSIYRLAVDQIDTLLPPDRWRRLQAGAMFQRASVFAKKFQPTLFPNVIWASTFPETPHQTLRGHINSVEAVALGEIDGRPVIISAGCDKTIRLWHARSGAPIGEPLSGHDDLVSAVALGLVEGRQVIISGSDDKTIRLWDACSGAPIGKPLSGHESCVNALALGQVDGHPMIVSGGGDETVRVWDARTGALVRTLRGHNDYLMAVALDQVDGQPLIISASGDGTVRLWDARTGTPVRKPLRGHAGSVNAAALGEIDGRPVIVSGGNDQSIRLWDARTGRPIGKPLRGHSESVYALSICQVDGRSMIASGGGDYWVRLWDARTGTPFGEPLRGHSDCVNALAVGQVAGRLAIVSAGDDDTLRVWDTQTGFLSEETLNCHTDCVNAIALGEVGFRNVVVSGSDDETIRVLNALTGTQVDGRINDHDGSVKAVALGEVVGRPLVVSSGSDKVVHVWDARSGAPIRKLLGHDDSVNAVALGEVEGRPVIVSGGDDNTVRIWDISTEQTTCEVLHGHRFSVNAVALSEVDGRLVVVSCGGDKTVRLWNARTGAPIGNPFFGHDGSVNALAVGEVNGRPVIVSGSDDKTVRRWDLRNGTPIGEPLCGHGDYVTAVALGVVEGRPVIVSGGDDYAVRLWDAGTGAPIGEPLFGHGDCVTALALVQVNSLPMIISGGKDKAVRLWNGRTGVPVGKPLHGHDDWINAIAFGQVDGRPMIVSGSDDHTFRIWDAKLGEPVAQPLCYHGNSVCAVAAGRIGGRPLIISGGDDNNIRLWDARDGAPIGEPLQGHIDTVNAVALGEVEGHPVIVSGSDDGTVRLWDGISGKSIGRPLRGHGSCINAVALGELEGKPVIVSASEDQTVRLWDPRAGRPIGKPLHGHIDTVNAVALGEVDGRPVIVSGGDDETVRLWDARTGKSIGQPLQGHTDSVNAVALGEVDGRLVIVSGGDDETVRLWDAKSGMPLTMISLPSRITSLVINTIGITFAGCDRGVTAVQFSYPL